MKPSVWMPAVAALAATATAAAASTARQTSDTDADANVAPTGRFEVDIVFPRNDTYKMDDVFPIVMAIQNYSAVTALGTPAISWFIMPFRSGRIPGGVTYDSGRFELPDSSSSGDDTSSSASSSSAPALLVGATNTTSWIRHKRDADTRFMLQWSIEWEGLADRCDDDDGGGAPRIFSSRHMFNVVAAWGDHHPDAWAGPLRDAVIKPDECPQLTGLVEIQSNPSPNPNANDDDDGGDDGDACPVVVDLLRPVTGVEEENGGGDDGDDDDEDSLRGSPCAVEVDAAAVSDIVSRASSMLAPTATADITPTWSTSSAGVGPARTVQTALAAACLLGGLVL